MSVVRLSLALLALAAPLRAQVPSADSLSLGALRAEALRHDPRQRQAELNAAITDRKLQNIAAERLPSFDVSGQAQYQSVVTQVPVNLPGISVPTPPHDTYDAHLNVLQTILDPSVRARRNVERAQLDRSQADTRAALYTLRQDVDEAFYAAAMVTQRLAALDVSITELSSRLAETVTRFRDGAALPGDTAAIAAALLQREQDALELRANRSAALARLSELVGRDITERDALLLPNDSSVVATTLRTLDTLRARPEYAQFSAARAVLDQQRAVIASQEKPRVAAFARAGYGRPGLDMLSRDFERYWLAGVQVQWAPWTWGRNAREQEVAELQRDIVTTNEQAFTRQLRRNTEQTVATLARLDTTLALDDRIVALRERVDTEARIKLREGVITPSEYIDRNTELLSAQLARVQHRVALAQARTALLTTVGVDDR